jgi:hypothetical protein
MTGVVADIKEVAIAVTSVLLIAPLPRLASRWREFESRQAGDALTKSGALIQPANKGTA